MDWPAIRRTLTNISVSLLLAFLAAPGFCTAGEPYARDSLNGSMGSMVNSGAAELLLLSGILVLAAASAAVAVRMVRRSH